MPLELIGGCILNCRHAATHSCAPRSSTRAISQPLGREGAKKRHPEASGAHFGERGRRNYSEPAGWPNLITSRLPLACFAAETGGLIGLERRRFCANNRRRARLSAALLISRHVLSPPLARVRAPSGQTLRPTGDLRASARSNYLAAREQSAWRKFIIAAGGGSRRRFSPRASRNLRAGQQTPAGRSDGRVVSPASIMSALEWPRRWPRPRSRSQRHIKRPACDN